MRRFMFAPFPNPNEIATKQVFEGTNHKGKGKEDKITIDEKCQTVVTWEAGRGGVSNSIMKTDDTKCLQKEKSVSIEQRSD